MIHRLLFILAFLSCGTIAFAQQGYTVLSPDGKIKVSVELNEKVTYTITHDGEIVISPSPISMKLTSGETLGATPRLKNVKLMR